MGLRIVVLCLLVCSVLGSVHSQNWIHHTVLDEDGLYNFYWNPPKDKKGDREIMFKVVVQANGYVALGFLVDGELPGSDIVTGWIHEGDIHFQDKHAIADGLPILDSHQDYQLIGAYENDTFTVFEFSRKLDTCDKNDTVIDRSTLRVIYAYSNEDPASDDPFYLENQGKKSIFLLQGHVKSQDLDYSSLLQWDLKVPEIEIPAVDTLYWCTIVKSPEISEKHHIVNVKPMIQKGNEKFINHFGLYECVGGTAEEYEHLVDDRGYECYQPSMPEPMFKCEGIIVFWVIGSEDIVYPENVGFALERETYYMYQVHYDNPDLQSGIIDSSGITLYHTPSLREFDAGAYLVGASVVPMNFIPPGQEEYVMAGHSSSECIKKFLPEDGGRAFAISLHTNLIGRQFKVRHFRQNEELMPLANDEHYDPSYQPHIYYMEEVVILQNDQITVECIYNSTKRPKVTFSGLRITDETCLIVILYYPGVSHSRVSYSVTPYATINEVLNTNLRNEADVLSVLGSYDWKSVNIDEVQNAMRYSEQETQCYYSQFLENVTYTLTSYPDDFKPYVPESTCSAVA